MNYVVEYAELRNGEWIAGKYQVMSAFGIRQLTAEFYGLYSREQFRIERAIWWDPPGERHVSTRKTEKGV